MPENTTSAGRRLRGWWSAWQWRVAGVAAALAFVLGWRGFWSAGEAEGWSLGDCALLSLQLFILESPVEVRGAAVGWELHVARWLAPLVSSGAAIAGLLVLFRQEFKAWRMSRLRGHVVVCGLGGKGGRLAAGELLEGRRVVGIEQDSEASYWRDVEARGGLVALGNLEDPQVLLQARAHLAARVYCAAGSDEMNLRIVEHLDRILDSRAAAGRQGNTPECFVYVRDAGIRSLVARRFSQDRDSLKVTPYSVFQGGARALLLEHPAFSMDEDGLLEPRPVAVVGSGPLAGEVLEELAETWKLDPACRKGARLTVGVLDAAKSADGWPEWLYVREMEALEDGSFIASLREVRSALKPLVYVCLEDPGRGLSLASRWLDRASDAAEVVLCSVGYYSALASFDRPVRGRSITLHSFDLPIWTCSPSLVTGGIHEDVARAIHEVYRDIYPDDTPWEALDPDRRQDNIRLARFVAANLYRAGLRFCRWCAGDPTDPLALEDSVWEELARREHARWKTGKEAAGWRYGPVRDDERRENPYMLSWEELEEEKREENRRFIRGVLESAWKHRLRVAECEDGCL